MSFSFCFYLHIEYEFLERVIIFLLDVCSHSNKHRRKHAFISWQENKQDRYWTIDKKMLQSNVLGGFPTKCLFGINLSVLFDTQTNSHSQFILIKLVYNIIDMHYSSSWPSLHWWVPINYYGFQGKTQNAVSKVKCKWKIMGGGGYF